MKSILPMLVLMTASVTAPTIAASENKQCEMIAHLTSDYYHHRESGKSYDEVMQQNRPEFANEEFLRMADLAINLAFALPSDMSDSDIQDKVNESCLRYQPG